MAIKIVTDSTITIEPELVKELGITIVPLSLLIDGTVYKDTDLPFDEFMSMMKDSKTLPKTSQPPVGVFAEIYDELGADGSQIISIHMNQALSGTVEAARQASNLTNSDVTVIDSDFIDQALKFQVVEAAKLAQDGASKDEILAAIENIKNNTGLYIGVANLENLVKGGRIGRVTGMVGGFLNLKIIMEMIDQNLEPIAKGRGNKTFQKWLSDFAESLNGKEVREIGISHAENPEFAETLRKTLQPYVEKPISVLDTNSIVATHAGSGAWAVMIDYK